MNDHTMISPAQRANPVGAIAAVKLVCRIQPFGRLNAKPELRAKVEAFNEKLSDIFEHAESEEDRIAASLSLAAHLLENLKRSGLINEPMCYIRM